MRMPYGSLARALAHRKATTHPMACPLRSSLAIAARLSGQRTTLGSPTSSTTMRGSLFGRATISS
eukprot:2679019-Lingulodinium_polyedra.AAC.1